MSYQRATYRTGMFIVTALTLTACGGGSGDNGSGDSQDPSSIQAGSASGTTETGFPNVNDFAAAGPFDTLNASRGPSCQIYRPQTLGQDGLDHPIVVWGNGTGGSPTTYQELLNHWASHGFVVAAAQTPQAGSGDEMLACLNFLEERNQRASGVFAGNLDLERVAMSGHSQGAGGAIRAGQDRRVTVTVPMQPPETETSSRSNQSGAMFLMSGGVDIVTPPEDQQRPIFDEANVPVFWGIQTRADHNEPPGDAGTFRGPATAWLRFHLMDDSSAESGFFGEDCDLCADERWTIRTKAIN